MTFTELGINEGITRALQENKITIPSDIQTQTIPHILNMEMDLVAIAQTGTGKTAAFCLPILQSINPKQPTIQALVIVPTRELGQQVAREFFLFSKYIPRVFIESVFGGSPIGEQIQKLKRPTNVVVATPGRLIDLLERNALSLADLNFLVLDEADEMISMGFKADIDTILESCKEGVVKMLFTATMPSDIKQMINEYLSPDAIEIRINAEEFVNAKIEHLYLTYTKDRKLDYLKAFLSERQNQRGIAFCRTKTDAKQLAKKLGGFVVVADALHGNLNQESREKVMRGFKKGRINLLVATDIAARGIDVKDLDYIIHYDLPEKAEQYTHRSGRTARAGQSGVSINFVKNAELSDLKSMLSPLKISFKEIEVDLLTDKDDSSLMTVYMNMGLNQDFTNGSLIELLLEESGLDFADITNMEIEEERSHFDIPKNCFERISVNLKNMKIAHRNLRLALDEKSCR